jgi:hypothetical protein
MQYDNSGLLANRHTSKPVSLMVERRALVRPQTVDLLYLGNIAPLPYNSIKFIYLLLASICGIDVVFMKNAYFKVRDTGRLGLRL